MKGKILLGCIALVMLFACSKSGHIHLPGHGNVEKQNLKEAVVNHVSSTLTNGETVEFGGYSAKCVSLQMWYIMLLHRMVQKRSTKNKWFAMKIGTK